MGICLRLQASGDVDLLPASDTQVAGGFFTGPSTIFHVNSEGSLFGNGSATINNTPSSMLIYLSF